MTRKVPSQKSRQDDPVRDYMKSRGVSANVVDAGLAGAVARWESVAKSVDGYDLTLDDWLNDMGLRDIIAGALAAAGEAQRKGVSARLERADDVFRKATVVTGPVWGKTVAASHSHDPARTWWYFRLPRNPGETLKADLDADRRHHR